MEPPKAGHVPGAPGGRGRHRLRSGGQNPHAGPWRGTSCALLRSQPRTVLAAGMGAQCGPSRLPMPCPAPLRAVRPGRMGCGGMAVTAPGQRPSAQAASLGRARGRWGRSTAWPRPVVGDWGSLGVPKDEEGQRVQSGRADAQRARESREAAAAPNRIRGPTAAAGCLPSAPPHGDPQPGPGDAAAGSG